MRLYHVYLYDYLTYILDLAIGSVEEACSSSDLVDHLCFSKYHIRLWALWSVHEPGIEIDRVVSAACFVFVL